MNFGKKRIFLVDDDVMFEDIIVNFLSDEYEIMLSHSGEEALNKIIKHKPDLILLDVILPEMDGWEIFHKIKGITLINNVPIAFLTSLSEEEGLEHAKQIGAAGYFLKPIEKEELVKGIEKILSGEKLI